MDRDDLGHRPGPAGQGVGTREHPAAGRAISHRHDPFGIGSTLPGPTQRRCHVAGHGAGHHQDVGMLRTRREPDAEAFEIVDRVGKGVDLEFATVAGTGIDLADHERTAEPS